MREEQTLDLGLNPMNASIVTEPTVQEETPKGEAPKRIDWRAIAEKMVKSVYFWPTLIFVIGLSIVFWPLISYSPVLWTGPDGYYTHGFLVPLISGYLVFKAWPKLKETPIKPVYWVAIFLPIIFWCAYAARLAELRSVASVMFIATLMLGTAFVFGWKWMAKLAPATLYLLFALPIWSGFVTNYTNPLQIYSSKAAYKMLQLFYDPWMSNNTTILVGRFWLDVGVPCSGLKLVLAITAFTFFFMLIGGLKWWANVMMLALILPLCLFVNGLRIALIGAVGEAYGDNAGHVFHDYSGYLTLIVCFFILFKAAKVLGWKG